MSFNNSDQSVDGDHGNHGNHDSFSSVSDSFSSVSDSFNFQPTLKLSDTLRLPTMSKCLSDSNLPFRKKSVGSGKSILKSKSESQLTSILKDSTSRESEEDRYLFGGYSEVVEVVDEVGGSSTRIRPELKYTKSESQNGTYGFDSCRYVSGSDSYSYTPGRLSRSKSEESTPTTSYTRSIDHFTLNVVEGSQEGEGSRKRSSQSLADTLKFPKEYKYDHLTLRGDELGEYGVSDSGKSTFVNSVPSDFESTTNRGISRTRSTSSTSSSSSNSSSSSEELIWSPRQSNVRAEPLRQNPELKTTPRSSIQPPSLQSSSESYASRSTGPRPSDVSKSLTAAAASRQLFSAAESNRNHYTLSSQACFDGLKSVPSTKKPVKEESSSLSSSSEDSEDAEDHFNIPLSPQYTPKRSLTHEDSHVTDRDSHMTDRDSHVTKKDSHVTQPHQHPAPCHVTTPDPPKTDLPASISHIVPQLPAQQQEAPPPPSSRESSLVQYQNSKSRAVANLRSRQLLQARGIRVLPPSPLRWLSHVRSDYETDETDSVISRDAETHSPDLSIVAQQLPRRPSLFRSYSGQKMPTIMETRDQVFKTPAESTMFKSRDLLEKLKFRKPTTFSWAKCLVDEILLFPARYMLIKREKLRKYALFHSAVTNCYILNTGWSRDEKTRFFSKAEGPFILKINRRR